VSQIQIREIVSSKTDTQTAMLTEVLDFRSLERQIPFYKPAFIKVHFSSSHTIIVNSTLQ